MLVTPGTFERQTQEGHRKGVVAVGDVFDAELLQRAAAFDLLRVQAVEGGGQPRVVGRLGQQVAGQLQSDEPVIRHVLVESPHHPVAIRPHVAVAIDLVTVRVRVACDVEPFGGHPFAIGGRPQQTVDDLLERLVQRDRPVGNEGVDLLERRWQSGQIERDAADQTLTRRRPRRINS